MKGITLIEKHAIYKEGKISAAEKDETFGSMAKEILSAHNQNKENDGLLKIKFDAITSHDITYVGIIQTARASGLKKFPLPYVLTCCHNSLCAVGGTINEDDHLFGLTACKKFGGVFVPPHLAVIHQYARERLAKAGEMILGSDSHTRYGALGCLAIGEGGGELAKQLLNKTYDVQMPKVVAVYLSGTLVAGVGPQDIALAIIKEVFQSGFVKNCVMEFVGPGVKNLSMEDRIALDVMTTETTCLSSIWETDEKTHEYYITHGREGDYKALSPAMGAVYDKAIVIDLSEIRPMIALPSHPSNAWTIEDFRANMGDILAENDKKTGLQLTKKIHDKKLLVDQGIVAGCAGGSYENIMAVSKILKGGDCGSGAFSLSIYPASMPIYKALVDNGAIANLISAGAVIKTAYCGPCFGAGDTPSNGALSIRHTTRNFPNRDGSKPQNGQSSGVALMDARSIAATALNKGILTAGTEVTFDNATPTYYFDGEIYNKRVFDGRGKANENEPLILGPNIKDWPELPPLGENLLLKVVSVIEDEVTTTDELIPSGETSSYRSNPLALAEFTLSRRDPEYVARAKKVRDGGCKDEIASVMDRLGVNEKETQVASTIYANKPGDGSAREQAASCQRVLGAAANIAHLYATKRYRSNLINWGMIPLLWDGVPELGCYILLRNIRTLIDSNKEDIPATILSNNEIKEITLKIDRLTADEKKILLAGSLINYYKGN